MDNSRRSNFMGTINARQYNNRDTRVSQSNNPNRINPNNRNNNNSPQQKRTIQNNVEADSKRYRRIITRGTVALAALIATAITTGVVINNNTNENIDHVHEAYGYVASALSGDERAINKEGYQDYIENMAAFDRTFEKSNKEEFHDFIKTLGIQDTVLDSEQITNLALEVFKVAFGEKYGVDPINVKVENSEPDIIQMREEFDYKTGKYKCTSITYKTDKEDTIKLTKDYLIEGYFSYGSFEPSGKTTDYSDDIPEAEYDTINAIIKAQSDEKSTRKAVKALKAAQEYSEKVKSEIQQEQSGVERED